MPVLLNTDLPLPLFIRGKVRDTYDLGEFLLIVATDRISAFDVVLPVGIPDKGKVLNLLSAFWFERTKHIVPNHVKELVQDVRSIQHYRPGETGRLSPELAGRSMIVKKAQRIAVECVVRGYLAGSAWSEYQQSGTVCGIALARGFRESQKLPRPIFTPTTKAETGHDEPMTIAQLKEQIGTKLAEQVESNSIAIYNHAAEYALSRGIIIADTKMEFGISEGELTLIDELLTPDSSRFWEASQFKAGQSQPSYDKQPVRDWLVDSGWNKLPPAPPLPNDVVEATTKRYREAFQRLTGSKLP